MITSTDNDGIEVVRSIIIDLIILLVTVLAGSVITTAAGAMTIDSFDPVTGIASFIYELTTPVVDVPNQPETDVFTVVVSDGISTSPPAEIVFSIVDDVPTARNDTDL